MALWGSKDGAPFGALTATVAANPGLNLLTFSDSIASYGVEPGNTIIVDTAGTPQYVRVKQVISETIIETTTNMTAVAGVDCELQQSPKYTSITEVTAGNIVGADLSEVAAGGTTDPGWLRKFTKTRDGVTVTLFETLVASSSINEDVVNEEFPAIIVPDAFTITAQPQDIDAGWPPSWGGVVQTPTMFITVTESGPSTTLYNWEKSDDNGATWVSVDQDNTFNGNLYRDTNTNGDVTTSTTSITFYLDETDSFLSIYDGFQFRVVVSKGAVTETSAVATLNIDA